MNINDLFPSKYIKSDDLQGQRIKLTIMSVTVEEITDAERKPVMRFMGKEKGMILNKTNGLSLAVAFGDDTNSWQGRDIELLAMPTMFQGKQVMGLVCLPLGLSTPAAHSGDFVTNPPRTYDEITQAQYNKPGPHDIQHPTFIAPEVAHPRPISDHMAENGPAIEKGKAQQEMEQTAADIEAAEQRGPSLPDEPSF